MDTILQATLATVIQQLADFFGMTTDAIMANAPMWLAKYGWFAMMQNLVGVVALWTLLVGFYVFTIWFTGTECDWKKSSMITAYIVGCLLLSMLIFGTWFGQCAVSPELYGLQAILKLIKGS